MIFIFTELSFYLVMNLHMFQWNVNLFFVVVIVS